MELLETHISDKIAMSMLLFTKNNSSNYLLLLAAKL